MRNRLETPVARHMNSHNYRGNPPIRIYILTLIHEKPDSEEAGLKRKLKEICIYRHLIKHGHDWENNSHGSIEDVVVQHA